MSQRSLYSLVESFAVEDGFLDAMAGNSTIIDKEYTWTHFAWPGEKSMKLIDLQIGLLSEYFGLHLKQPNEPVRIPSEFIPFFNEMHKGGTLYGNLLVNAGVVEFNQLLDSLAAQDSIRGVPGPRVLVDLTVSQVPYGKKETQDGLTSYEIARLTPYTRFHADEFKVGKASLRQDKLACKIEIMGFYPVG